MDPAAIRAHVEATCPGVTVMEDAGSLFFVYNPRNDPAPAASIPFATVVTSDKYDPGSDLSRRAFFRLNVGVSLATYKAMFGAPPPFPKDGGIVQTGHDFTAVDTWLPHPVYAAMAWVCVVQPDKEWPRAKGLLAEAFQQARKQKGL